MKILYCTDFTEASLYSMERVFPFLKSECRVDIISVIEVDFMTALGVHPSIYKDYLEMCRENKNKKLEKIKPVLQKRGLAIDKILFPRGEAADEILKQLNKENYSLIISGSRTKVLFGKWLGSTSRKITEKSHVPIFIARKREIPISTSGQKRVLFAVDGTENSYNSVKNAIEIFNLKKSTVEILHVKKGKESLPAEIIADKDWLETILKKEQELSAEIIERACDIAEKSGIQVSSRTVLEGPPVEKILLYTEKNEKDLIVMGSHGREGLSSLLLGSVSKGVLDNTYCPIVIIPTKKTKETF